MDNLINYQPTLTGPQEARMLTPLVGEHQTQNIREPLVNLVGSLRNWAGEAKDKELEKAKLDLAANNNQITPEQETNWLLSDADLKNLQISASSQTWGAQHLIDQKQYEHLTPEQYQQHLASEAKLLTDNSANPEWMATRLNQERAQLAESHARAHAEYSVVKGVTVLDQLMGNRIAKTQEVVQKTQDPVLKNLEIEDNYNFFTELLNDPQRGHMAWLAFQKRRNQQLSEGDPTYYNLQEQLVSSGRLHKGSLDADPGLQEALTQYSSKASSNIVTLASLWVQKIKEGDDTTQIRAAFENAYALASSSKAPLSAQAKAIIASYAQDVTTEPAKVEAAKETHRTSEMLTLQGQIEATAKDYETAYAENNGPSLQHLDSLMENYSHRINSLSKTPEEKQSLQQHLEGSMLSAINKGGRTRVIAKIEPLVGEMNGETSATRINELTLEVRRNIHNGGLATKEAKQALDLEYRDKISKIYHAKLTEMAASLPEVDASESPAAANRVVLDMLELMKGNDVLPKAAGSIWTKGVLKLLNDRLKHHEPELAVDLQNALAQFKGVDGATVTAAIGKAFAEGNTSPALALYQKNILDNREGLRAITGIAPASEAEAYQQLIPKENLSKFDVSQNLRGQALKLGADPDKVDSVYRLIHRGDPFPKEGTSNPGAYISRTKALSEAFEPGKFIGHPMRVERLEPSVLVAEALPKEIKAFENDWIVNPDKVVQALKTQTASVGFATKILKEYIADTSYHAATDPQDVAIQKLLTKDIEGEEPGTNTGLSVKTGLRLLDMKPAEASALRAEALIKTVAMGKLEDKGSINQQALNLQYSTSFHPGAGNATSGQYLTESSIYKATSVEDQDDLLELFQAAGKYASTPQEQIRWATEAMNATQYATSSGLRISNYEGLRKDLEAGAVIPELATFDQVLGHPLVQKFFQGRQVNQAADLKQEIHGSSLHWYYNSEKKELTGLDPRGVAEPLILDWNWLRLARHKTPKYHANTNPPGFNPFSGKYGDAPTPFGKLRPEPFSPFK